MQADGAKKTLTGKELVQWKYQRYMQDYLACVQGVDDSVGKLLDYLDEAGLETQSWSTAPTMAGTSAIWGCTTNDSCTRVPDAVPVRWPQAIKSGSTPARSRSTSTSRRRSSISPACPSASMQGVSLVPLLRGESPDGWRTSVYYRYYHDPGHHNTAAHLGVRTATHKLIYYWTKDQLELFDLVHDPYELHNLYGQPGQDGFMAGLKAELFRLKREVRDEDQLSTEQLPNSVDGPVARLRGK